MPEEYQISRRAGRCTACSRDFARGEEHYSALVAEPPPPVKQSGDEKPPAPAGEAPGPPGHASMPYRRLDFCAACWKPEAADGFFSFWKTAVPDEDPDKDKPLARRIDTETVYEMFRRLEGQPDPEKQKFRFILALILMRKKRLRFTGVASGAQGEHLVLEDRTEGVTHKVLDPGLAEEEIDSLKGAVDRLLRGGDPEGDGPAQ